MAVTAAPLYGPARCGSRSRTLSRPTGHRAPGPILTGGQVRAVPSARCPPRPSTAPAPDPGRGGGAGPRALPRRPPPRPPPARSTPAACDLTVWEWGDADAPPVLFAHGGFDFAGTFDTLAPLVADAGWRVVSLGPAGPRRLRPRPPLLLGRRPPRRRWRCSTPSARRPIPVVGHSKGGALHAAAGRRPAAPGEPPGQPRRPAVVPLAGPTCPTTTARGCSTASSARGSTTGAVAGDQGPPPRHHRRAGRAPRPHEPPPRPGVAALPRAHRRRRAPTTAGAGRSTRRCASAGSARGAPSGRWRGCPSLGMPVLCVLGLETEVMGWGTLPEDVVPNLPRRRPLRAARRRRPLRPHREARRRRRPRSWSSSRERRHDRHHHRPHRTSTSELALHQLRDRRRPAAAAPARPRRAHARPRAPSALAAWPGPGLRPRLHRPRRVDRAPGGGYTAEVLMADVDTALAHLGAVHDRRPRPRRLRRAADRRRPAQARRRRHPRRRPRPGRRRPAPDSPLASRRRRPSPATRTAPGPDRARRAGPRHPARRLRRHLRPPGAAVLGPRPPDRRGRRGPPAVAGGGGRRARAWSTRAARPTALAPLRRRRPDRRAAEPERRRGGQASRATTNAARSRRARSAWSGSGMAGGRRPPGRRARRSRPRPRRGRRWRRTGPGGRRRRRRRGRDRPPGPSRSLRRRRRPARGPRRAAAWACPRAGRRRPACRCAASSAEHAEHVVAELERLAQRVAVGAERPRPGRVAGRAAAPSWSGRSMVYRPDLSRAMRRAPARSTSPVAVPARSRYWPMLSSMRSSCQSAASSGGAVGQQLVGVDEGQVAGQDGDALAEAAGLAGPGRGRRGGRRTGGGRRERPGAPPSRPSRRRGSRAKRLEQLERGAGVDDRAGRSGSPPAATKPQWQNAGRSRLPPAMTRAREGVERAAARSGSIAAQRSVSSSSSTVTRASTRAATIPRSAGSGSVVAVDAGPAIAAEAMTADPAIPPSASGSSELSANQSTPCGARPSAKSRVGVQPRSAAAAEVSAKLWRTSPARGSMWVGATSTPRMSLQDLEQLEQRPLGAAGDVVRLAGARARRGRWRRRCWPPPRRR